MPFTVDLEESDDKQVSEARQTANKLDVAPASEDEDDVGIEPETGDDEDGILQEKRLLGAVGQDGDGDEDEHEDEEDDDAEDPLDVDLPSDLSADETEPDSLDGLDSFVQQLASADSTKKGAVAGKATQDPTKTRRVLPVVRGPPLSESDGFGLKSSAACVPHSSYTS